MERVRSGAGKQALSDSPQICYSWLSIKEGHLGSLSNPGGGCEREEGMPAGCIPPGKSLPFI